ncbi:MAG TPA: FAD-binding oxidoreductase [Rhizomicrobium sp.]|nr:FAD-binding oxidoreductase [Rhizomicrobium sp.]
MKHSSTKGRTWVRGEPGFDVTVLATSFNARDPGVRPAVLVQANTVDDVVAAVRRARDEGLRVAICSGGHSWTQNHIRDGGLLIDLSRLNDIVLDADAMVASVGPGCLSGRLDDALRRKRLFFPVAHAYTVGLGGFLLQGGFGWNSRVMGLGCENVIGFDAVLADGSLVHASESENADLFWAARGAGPFFFAAIVRFHLRLHPRPRFTGLKMQIFRMTHLEEVFAWADRAGPNVSPSVEFQMVLNRKALVIGAPGIEVLAPVIAGSWRAARDAVRFLADSPLRAKASFTAPLFPISLATMMKTGERSLFLPDTHWYSDNMWIEGGIAPLLPALRKIADTQPPAPSHALWLNWNPVAARKDMAFSVEGRTYLALYGGLRREEDVARHAGWATDAMKALEPYSRGIQLADENLTRRPARFMSDANLARLAQVRAHYDPNGLFTARSRAQASS